MRFTTVTLLVALLAVAASANILSTDQYEALFINFARKFNKKYESNDVQQRFENFKKNLDYIMTENSSNKSYTLGMNPTGDLSFEEYKAKYLGDKPQEIDTSSPLYREFKPVEGAQSTSIDWERKGEFDGILNQAQCGSCYSFCAVQALAHAGLRIGIYNTPTNLAAQQPVDCAGSYGNLGCNGGLSTYVYEYAKKNPICYAKDYPYTGRDGSCQASKCTPAVGVKTYTVSSSEAGIPQLLNQGIMAVSVMAGNNAFRFYKSGIIDDPACGTATDHCITLVGYNAEQNYYRIANSWGTSWGENGFVRIRAGKNMCGISRRPVLPEAFKP